jgi:hypothetical protein
MGMPTQRQTQTPEDDLATLRAANKNLKSALARFHPERQHCSAIKAHELSDLRSAIQQAADCLRGISRQAAPELKNESLEYRGNLEQLKQLLPDFQLRLLAEKSRLEVASSHVAAAAAWAGTGTTTF